MTRKVKVFLVTGVVLALYAIAVWFIGSALGQAGDRWMLRGSLWVLGLVGAERRGIPAEASAPHPRREPTKPQRSTRRLPRSKALCLRPGGRAKIGRMPLVLLLGPEGVQDDDGHQVRTRSRLLAGEVFRGDAVTPTRSLNAWISQGTVFVEAGGRLSSDEGRWGRLIQHLLPDRLRAALSSGMQAPRLAVVC